MKFFLLFFFNSVLLFGQLNNEKQNQIKFKSYSHLDSINVYSNNYPTKLIEGSGFIKDKKNKNIGSIGYSIEITRDKNDKMIRALKSESIHYKIYNKKPQKSIISAITIYFDESQQPDLAKKISNTLILNSLVRRKTDLFDLKKNNEDIPEFKDVKKLLEVLKNEKPYQK